MPTELQVPELADQAVEEAERGQQEKTEGMLSEFVAAGRLATGRVAAE